MDKREIRKIYNLLKGTYKAIKEIENKLIEKKEINQFNELLQRLTNETLDGYFSMYFINSDDYYHEQSIYCTKGTFLLRLLPVLEYIENEYLDDTEEVIKKIGALYNCIEDLELQKRCGDILLEGTGAFDRVINQATQILEDRIKKKAQLQNTVLIGHPLVSRAIHSKLDRTILKFSDSEDIQENYASLFKGITGVYRNQSHHGTEFECTREEALKFCAYIDVLLSEIDKCVFVEQNNNN